MTLNILNKSLSDVFRDLYNVSIENYIYNCKITNQFSINLKPCLQFHNQNPLK